MHFQKDYVPSCQNRHYSRWFYSLHPDKKASGVSIAIQKCLPFQLKDQLIDLNKCFLFLKFSICHRQFTVINVYLTNQNQVTMAGSILSFLRSFAPGTVLVAGDLNPTLEPAIDASTSKYFFETCLIDIWWILYPIAHNYTFYSHPHGSYSRIDYFYTDHYLLD